MTCDILGTSELKLLACVCKKCICIILGKTTVKLKHFKQCKNVFVLSVKILQSGGNKPEPQLYLFYNNKGYEICLLLATVMPSRPWSDSAASRCTAGVSKPVRHLIPVLGNRSHCRTQQHLGSFLGHGG